MILQRPETLPDRLSKNWRSCLDGPDKALYSSLGNEGRLDPEEIVITITRHG